MLSAEYINAIRSMYKLTLTEFWLYYQLMHNVDWNQWPGDLQRIVSEWGRQHGTQSYDIRADLIAAWVRDLRDQGA